MMSSEGAPRANEIVLATVTEDYELSGQNFKGVRGSVLG
jgi:hypothetical protein